MKLKLWAIVDGEGNLGGDGEIFWIFKEHKRAREVLSEVCEDKCCQIVKLESKPFRVKR